MLGAYATASHNEAFKFDVLPPLSDYSKTFSTGIKYTSGLAIVMFVVFLPVILIYAYLFSNLLSTTITGNFAGPQSFQIMAGLILFSFILWIVSIILWLKYGIPAVLLFFRNLNLSDMLSFKKISKFGEAIKKDYWMYILFSILISIILGIVSNILMQVLTPFILIKNPDYFQMAMNPQASSAAMNDISAMFGTILPAIGSIISISPILSTLLSLLLLPNLNGQVIKNTLKSNIKQKADSLN